ncbi:MAG: Crp/Fnr family transcriptional regulator [Candidatus Limnocylindria bacterium]
MDPHQIADLLGEMPVFAPLSADERLVLARRMRPRRFAKGEVVFHRDDPAGHLYLIAAGTVKVATVDERGHEIVLAVERGGDVFGELALFDGEARSATVTAMNETEALTLQSDDFFAVLEHNPRAMRQLLALLARMVRRASGRVEDLVFLDVPSRVAKRLTDLAEIGGSAGLDLTQEDLASFVGATRVSVNRVLADLDQRGLVKIGRRHIEIPDVEALRREIRY